MNYKVGQVLYICDEKTMKIIPVQVVEEIIRNTLENGKEKNYIVMFPNTKKTRVNIDSIDGKIYESSEIVAKKMIENATDAINNMKNAAEILAEQSFANKNDQNISNVQVEKNNDIIMVDLGNGAKAKMNTKSLERIANK